MMTNIRKYFLAAALMTVWGTAPLCGIPFLTITLDPAGGSISGAPGDLIGWGFTLSSTTTDWLSGTSSALTFETNASVGIYTDFIGLQGGPPPSFAVGPLATWTQIFDGISEGAGSYAIAAGAIPFSQNSGLLLFSFDVFDGDPTLGGAQIDSDSESAPFTVTVTEPVNVVPEPATFGLLAFGLMGLIAPSRRRLRGDTKARRGR